MHSHIAHRLHRSSLSTVPPPKSSSEYSQTLADLACQIFFISPLPSKDGRPIYVLNASAFPDSKEVDFDELLPYVLARLPGEDELIGGREYEIVFFAGAGVDGPTSTKKNRPGWGWFVQAYNTLNRATRKRLQKLYIVHERSWVRILVEMFSTIVSPKFRKKIYHVSTISQLALQMPIEDLLIPISVYQQDRQHSSSIHAPFASGRRAFAAARPFPQSSSGHQRLPRVLRETTRFLLLPTNIETEGLFRVPPNAKLLDVVRESYDRAQKFIIWKEGPAVLPQPAHEPKIADIDLRDGFGPLMAAGLIKLWYRELRLPVVPSSAYKEIASLFGDPTVSVDPARLIDLLSLDSTWSCLPLISRQILIRHLLPLLHCISEFSETNKMTPSNLAVCLAPTLLCSNDPVKDASMGVSIRRVLDEAIGQWGKGLREVLGASSAAFQTDLLDPESIEDFEDPLDNGGGISTMKPDFSDSTTQLQGITLQDHDTGGMEPPSSASTVDRHNTSGSSAQLDAAPGREAATPPSVISRNSDDTTSVRRKPAPPVTIPPRYSVAFPNDADADPRPETEAPRYSTIMADSPSTYAATTDGFRPRVQSQNDPSATSAESATKEHGTGTISEPQTRQTTRKALTLEQIESINVGLAPLLFVSGTPNEVGAPDAGSACQCNEASMSCSN